MEGLAITKDAEKAFGNRDTIAIAAGYQPNQSLYGELKGKVRELYLIGDSREPKSILEAIHEGFQAAISL